MRVSSVRAVSPAASTADAPSPLAVSSSAPERISPHAQARQRLQLRWLRVTWLSTSVALLTPTLVLLLPSAAAAPWAWLALLIGPLAAALAGHTLGRRLHQARLPAAALRAQPASADDSPSMSTSPPIFWR